MLLYDRFYLVIIVYFEHHSDSTSIYMLLWVLLVLKMASLKMNFPLILGKQKEIEKIFSNCEQRLRVYQQELEEADKEEM